MANSGGFPSFDFSKMMSDYSKMMSDMRVPGFDMTQFMSGQQKNFEAIAKANTAAMQGVQAITQRQAEMMREALEEYSKAMQGLASSGAPQDKVAQNQEVMQHSLQKAMERTRELSEMVAKSNTEYFEIVNQRLSEIMDDLRAQTNLK